MNQKMALTIEPLPFQAREYLTSIGDALAREDINDRDFRFIVSSVLREHLIEDILVTAYMLKPICDYDDPFDLKIPFRMGKRHILEAERSTLLAQYYIKREPVNIMISGVPGLLRDQNTCGELRAIYDREHRKGGKRSFETGDVIRIDDNAGTRFLQSMESGWDEIVIERFGN